MIEAFNQKIPNNPAKSGAENYDRQKKEFIEKKHQEKLEEAKKYEKEKFAPFDKPLSKEQRNVETENERNIRLIKGIEDNITIFEQKIAEAPVHLKNRQGYEEQVVELKLLKDKILDKENND